MGTILIAGGFYTDAGANVSSEPARVFDADAPAEMIAVYLDIAERPTEAAHQNSGWLVNMVIIGKRRASADGLQAAQLEILEDIERAMAPRSGWPAGISAPKFQEAKFINRAEGLTWVGVAVRYTALIARPRN